MPRKNSSKEQTSRSVDESDIDMDDYDYEDDNEDEFGDTDTVVAADSGLRARRQLEILREERELRGILDDYGDWQKSSRRGNGRKHMLRKNTRVRSR